MVFTSVISPAVKWIPEIWEYRHFNPKCDYAKSLFYIIFLAIKVPEEVKEKTNNCTAQEPSILNTIVSFETHIYLSVNGEYCSTAINDQHKPAARLFCSFNKSNHHYHLLSPHCLPGNLLSISLTLCCLSLTTTQCSHYKVRKKRLKMVSNSIKSKYWIPG